MIKINMGCGRRNFGSEWVHIDGGDYSHLDYYDIQNLKFEDNAVDLIYASHVLEYFDREEVIELLKEWRRVLKPAGTLRLAVPDFKAMVELYNRGYKLEGFLGPLYGKMLMQDKKIYHKTVYDFKSLSSLLASVDFISIGLYDWRETEHLHIDDHSQAYLPHMDKESGTLISLNLECTKKENL